MVKHDVPRFKQTRNMCGSYALKQISTYFGDDIPIKEIMSEAKANIAFGTKPGNVMSFLQKRYKIDLVTNYLSVFDLTWKNLSANEVIAKLEQRKQYKKHKNLEYDGFIKYFSLGGHVSFEPITKEMIVKMLDAKKIVLILVDSPYYYGISRKYRGKDDDIKGKDWGHYLVVAGYDKDKFYIVDPGTRSKNGYDWVDMDKVVVSILCRKPFIAGLEKI